MNTDRTGNKVIIHLILSLLFMLPAAGPVFAAGNSVQYSVNGVDYEGYYVSPRDKAPLVLLIHDWDGLTDYEIKRARMLADEGYAVFAADLFGAGVRPTEVRDKRRHTGELYTDREKMRSLMQAALDTAHSLGADTGNAVAMGYCFGGAAVLELARSGAGLRGFVSFHGGLATPEGQSYENTQGKVLVFHGSADTAITMEDFSRLTMELESHGIAHEMTSYGGAPHAFTHFGTERYRADADQASWQRFLTFLDVIFQ
jgi:dienelactone hydrolase